MSSTCSSYFPLTYSHTLSASFRAMLLPFLYQLTIIALRLDHRMRLLESGMPILAATLQCIPHGCGAVVSVNFNRSGDYLAVADFMCQVTSDCLDLNWRLNWRLLNPLEPRSFVFSFNLFCTYYRRHAYEIKYKLATLL